MFEFNELFNKNMNTFSIMFTIVSIFIGIVFILVIAMIISPKLRAKLMHRQVKSLKYMTEYSKKDMEDIKYNLEDAMINADNRMYEENYDKIKNVNTKKAETISDSIKIKTNAIKEGLSSSKEYCKYCGEIIDNDSVFCKKCGKQVK